MTSPLLRSAAALTIVIVAFGCHHAPSTRAVPGTRNERLPELAKADTSIFSAVLRQLSASNLTRPVRIDPRPLDSALTTTLPLPEVRRAPTDSVTQTRARAVSDAGFLVTYNAAAERCSSLAPKDAEPRPCLRARETRVAIAAARTGGAEGVPASLPSSELSTVRVIIKRYWPDMGSRDVIDLVFRKTPSGWQYVEQVTVLQTY